MCLKLLLSLFSKSALVIPHPEEPPDSTRTIENINLDEILKRWFDEWNVPEQYRAYWNTRGVIIEVTLEIPYPAGVYEIDGQRYMKVRPEWLNAGVIAHEQAHNSYALLFEDEKKEFSIVYTPFKTTTPLIKLLYSLNTYGLTNDVEGHAEIYRYLGGKLPEELKRFYPKLF